MRLNKSRISLTVGLPIIVTILLWVAVNSLNNRQRNDEGGTESAEAARVAELVHSNVDLAMIPDDQICDNAVAGDPDVADFYVEKLQRNLRCDWDYSLAKDYLVPSPSCILSLIENDIMIPANECLVQIQNIKELYTTLSPLGYPTPSFEIEGEEQTIFASYSSHQFKDIQNDHWPMNIEINGGGSGWFSHLAIYLQNEENQILGVYADRKGDRCNDGYARWERFNPKVDQAGYVSIAATPFRLLNPLDEINWRNEWIAWKFATNDREPNKQSFLDQAKAPLFNDWLPYEDIANCANCCVGQLLLKQSLVEDAKEVVAVLLDLKAISELDGSSLHLDSCIANNILSSEISTKPSVGLTEDVKLVSITEWLVLRDKLVEKCRD